MGRAVWASFGGEMAELWLRRRSFRTTAVAVLACVAVFAGGPALAAAPPAADPDASLPPVQSQGDASQQVPEGDRRQALGSEWASSGDAAYQLVGTADGLAVVRGTAKAGYRWETLAQITVPGVETDRWIGNFCLTADASRMVVVYAPRTTTNSEQGFGEGAWASVVDTKTGEQSSLGRGYSISYSNPGCGAGQRVALMRSVDDATSIASFDAVDKSSQWTADIPRQLTSPVPLADGSVLGATAGKIVRVRDGGAVEMVAKTTGTAFDLVVAGSRLTYAEYKGATATVKTGTVPATGTAALRSLGSGKLEQVGVAADSRGHTYVLGDLKAAGSVPDGIRTAPEVQPGADISTTGLVATSDAASPSTLGGSAAGDATIGVQSLETGKATTLEVPPAGGDVTSSPVGSPAASRSRVAAAAVGSKSNPSETERTCAVPRNDPRAQALQPKPRQVEWAVNRIVSGQLTISRPANWNSTGMAAYKPADLFPTKALSGGGRIPSQVLLGILAQESNLWQASRYTKPGATGNPQIGVFYGNPQAAGVNDNAFWAVDFSNADCGYGVGQVTDGMRLAGREQGRVTALPVAKQQAIALDYTVNIAAAAQILTDKWNQSRADGTTINNGDPTKIENWFAAAWAYNSGYHAKGEPESNGAWGLGWLNNPVNPAYPANRKAFLDGNAADAAHPQDWPYPEKIMGFAANSLTLTEKQTADAPPTEVGGYRTAWWNGTDETAPKNRTAVKPPLTTFCQQGVNECAPIYTGYCSRSDLHCWWHGNATWKKDCDTTCGNELYRFAPAADYMTEQPNGESFPPACTRTGLPSTARVIDDVPITTDAGTLTANPTRAGCSRVATEGSFRFDFGAAGASGSYPSKIDTHQLGGGFNDHFYFTHTWASNNTPASSVTGTWTLGGSLKQWGRVWIHTPDNGAWAKDARYDINLGDGRTKTRVLPQRNWSNKWSSVGVFQFNGTPSVSLSNITNDADDNAARDDVAWDAVAFEPLSAKPKDIVVNIGDSYSSGEGAPGDTPGGYIPVSDTNGDDTYYQNACHRSVNSWTNRAVLPGATATVASRDSTRDATLDYHSVACSGAQATNLLTTKQWEPPQLSQGYLDENTTLVTMSIGGNDIGFGDIIRGCIFKGVCEDKQKPSAYAALDILKGRLDATYTEIRRQALNAKIAVMGYPNIFEDGVKCVAGMKEADQAWLVQLGVDLNQTIKDRITAQNAGAKMVFMDPAPVFKGHNVCSADPAIHTTLPIVTNLYGARRSGEKAWFNIPVTEGADAIFAVSQQSFHPKVLGTGYEAKLLEAALK